VTVRSVEKSLKNWCKASLAFCYEQSLADAGSGGDVEPERRVDFAAFTRLATSRGIKPGDRVAGSDTLAPAIWVFDEDLTRTCPLNAGSPIEILGEIHEFLMSLCKRPLKESGEQGAKPRTVNGIFYTPKYIVDEIVQQTLGTRLRNANPYQAGRITILDPAAGCGAFLVSAYRTLLDWHLNWLSSYEPTEDASGVVRTRDGWKLTFSRCLHILTTQIYGVDLDPFAIEVLRRSLWLTMIESAAPESLPDSLFTSWNSLGLNFKAGHALIGHSYSNSLTLNDLPASETRHGSEFEWHREFPNVFEQGGFDVIIGNPPYRRERDFKYELDKIGETPFGRRYRSARMDLWYYFVHRGIELLKGGGSLSFITNAYWIQGKGSDKLIAALRDDVHLDELFLLRNQKVFAGVCGQHAILRLTKSSNDSGTRIKVVPHKLASSAEPFMTGQSLVHDFCKTKEQLFRDGRLDVLPPIQGLFDKLESCPTLSSFGMVRQGIAENPATINYRTLERFHGHPQASNWIVGDGVFSLQADEVIRLRLSAHESNLLRPYHDLCDLDRYWSASRPSRQLIFSTRQTCPEIEPLPQLRMHLERYRPILDARRETAQGRNCWWHLHWPRDDRIWQSDKLIALQMAKRPSFVPIFGQAYVPFSANVFVASAGTQEDLRYFSGLLNSKVLWAWFERHAKRRGVGLEVNGRTLERAPIRPIDFTDVQDTRRHSKLVELVDLRIKLSSTSTSKHHGNAHEINPQIIDVESRIDSLVEELYGLDAGEVESVNTIAGGDDR
jgi:adenine-specific DNA-methyltransferase